MAQDIRVIGLDHIVLNVADVERSLTFYLDELGLEPVRVEEWRAKGWRGVLLADGTFYVSPEDQAIMDKDAAERETAARIAAGMKPL